VHCGRRENNKENSVNDARVGRRTPVVVPLVTTWSGGTGLGEPVLVTQLGRCVVQGAAVDPDRATFSLYREHVTKLAHATVLARTSNVLSGVLRGCDMFAVRPRHLRWLGSKREIPPFTLRSLSSINPHAFFRRWATHEIRYRGFSSLVQPNTVSRCSSATAVCHTHRDGQVPVAGALNWVEGPAF
jgi:hypothetical protein